MRILSILGQKPEMTGSGVLVRELWECGDKYGDAQRLIVAAYPGDDYRTRFNGFYSAVTYTDSKGPDGELPFPILGMSDAMPYTSLRYSEARPWQIEMHLRAFRDRLESILSAFQPDVVHIHHLWVLASLARSCGNTPCFVTVHGTDLKQVKTAPRYVSYVHEGIGAMRKLFCVSSDILNDAIELYDMPSERAMLVGNGYNERLFRPDGKAVEFEGQVVVVVGKYVAWKGYRYLIRAFARLKRPVRLVILGSGPEAERQLLLSEAIAARIEDRLVLLGHLPQADVAMWLRRANVFVLPSVYEPFGLALLEAMACGCPVIASAAGGPKDVVSANLVSSGLATLVRPVRESDEVDEARYVEDIGLALERHLSDQLSTDDRVRISESVKGMEWSSVYQSVRAEYVKAIGAPEAG
jgi:glycosyltransferase involved in cell wall biosynthesis